MLVVSKSLCGYVSNLVQYNMESAQYLGESYYIIIIINKYILDIYIYIYNPWKIFCDLRFLEVYNCLVNVVINFKKHKVAEYFPWIKYIYI